MKHVIGVDPSLTATSIVVVHEYDEYTEQSFGSKPPPVASVRGTVARLEDLADRVARWMAAFGRIEMVIIEGYSFGSKHQAHQLGEFGGVLRSTLCKTFAKARIIEAPPKTLKQFACGNGGAGKIGIAVALARRYDVDFGSDDNKYDAYALARLAECVVGWAKPANEGQRKAVATILAMEKTA